MPMYLPGRYLSLPYVDNRAVNYTYLPYHSISTVFTGLLATVRSDARLIWTYLQFYR